MPAILGTAGSLIIESIQAKKRVSRAVLPFWPKYRLGHPENYLFLLSKKSFIGSKYPKINLFHFEKNFTVMDSYLKCEHAGQAEVSREVSLFLCIYLGSFNINVSNIRVFTL